MARKAQLFSLSKVVAKKRDEIAYARREMAQLACATAVFAPAYAVVNQIGRKCEELQFSRWMLVDPEVRESWDGQKSYSMSFVVEDYVDSLKDGVVPQVCEFLLDMGLTATETSDYASEYCAERKFRFTAQVGQVDLRVSVVANVRDSQGSCRKVKTGTKLQEVATYEIVCE